MGKPISDAMLDRIKFKFLKLNSMSIFTLLLFPASIIALFQNVNYFYWGVAIYAFSWLYITDQRTTLVNKLEYVKILSQGQEAQNRFEIR
jgi:hypothetical protein